MSRSNPHENAPNPAVRWFEWNGEHGNVRYYDKEKKANVDVALPFTFLLLDELATVRGWHEPSQSGIYANEVRDTRQDAFVVKSFKGGTLAEGFYKAIKDRVNAVGGQFVANCYIAFRPNGGDALEIGSMRFKGAALSAWMDFRKAHRGDLYTKAIQLKGYTEGKKGRIVFRVPVIVTLPASDATNDQAKGLDVVLQAWLTAYLTRTTTTERAETAAATPERHPGDDDIPPPDYEHPGPEVAITEDEVPF